MMRSGLRKPGAIPFFALILFSILSLVPSLAKEWDFYNLQMQIGYRGLGRNEARHLPRIKDGSIDARPRTRSTALQFKMWPIGGPCQSSPDRKVRPRRGSLDASPLSALEAASVLDSDPMPHTVTKPSSLTRGVRAFKTFFIKQLDEYQILQPISTGSAPSMPTEASRPLPPLANSSVTPAPHAREERSHITNQTTSTTKQTLDSPRIRFSWGCHDAWQQACRVATEFLQSLIATAGTISQPSNASISEFQHHFSQPPREGVQDGALSPKGTITQLIPMDGHSKSASPLNRTAVAAGQSEVAGVDPGPQKMRGSCMAIVIGLVVGVMWF